MLRDLLQLPEAAAIESLDAPRATELHQKVIEKKPFLQAIYRDFYREMIEAAGTPEGGVHVELGSGGGFMQTLLPGLVTSDILPLRSTDLCFSVENLPLCDESVDTFFMMNAAHHFPDALRALRELDRCLKPGGKIVMIEPANTPWGRFVYRNFHHEAFEPTGGWTFQSSGPLSGGNGALPWIVFVRDRARLEREIPRLQIEGIRYHTPMRWILSGGFTLRQLVPSSTHGLVRLLEQTVAPLGRWTGMFMTIRVGKAA